MQKSVPAEIGKEPDFGQVWPEPKPDVTECPDYGSKYLRAQANNMPVPVEGSAEDGADAPAATVTVVHQRMDSKELGKQERRFDPYPAKERKPINWGSRLTIIGTALSFASVLYWAISKWLGG
jgi:hypothetical protein